MAWHPIREGLHELLGIDLLGMQGLAIAVFSVIGVGVLTLFVADAYRWSPKILRVFAVALELRWRTLRIGMPSRLGGLGALHPWAKRFESGRVSAVEDAPRGYRFDVQAASQFRIYGGDGASLVGELHPLQNHCASVARRFRFRTLGGSQIRLYAAGWAAYSSPLEPRDLADAGIDPRRDLIAWASAGQMTLGGCESVIFSGDPSAPDVLQDVVIEVATFYPVA